MRAFSAYLLVLAACGGGAPGPGDGGALLPADRRIDWTRVGIAGGVPHRTRCADRAPRKAEDL